MLIVLACEEEVVVVVIKVQVEVDEEVVVMVVVAVVVVVVVVAVVVVVVVLVVVVVAVEDYCFLINSVVGDTQRRPTAPVSTRCLLSFKIVLLLGSRHEVPILALSYCDCFWPRNV